jgi:hypothetical protein
MKSGYVVYGYTFAESERARQDRTAPRIKAISSVYRSREICGEFMRLASKQYKHMEVRQK